MRLNTQILLILYILLGLTLSACSDNKKSSTKEAESTANTAALEKSSENELATTTKNNDQISKQNINDEQQIVTENLKNLDGYFVVSKNTVHELKRSGNSFRYSPYNAVVIIDDREDGLPKNRIDYRLRWHNEHQQAQTSDLIYVAEKPSCSFHQHWYWGSAWEVKERSFDGKVIRFYAQNADKNLVENNVPARKCTNIKINLETCKQYGCNAWRNTSDMSQNYLVKGHENAISLFNSL